MRKRFLALLVLATMIVSGCLPGQSKKEDPAKTPDSNTSTPVQKKPQSLKIPFANFTTIDPQVITNGMWLMPSLFEGLVLANEQGNGVIPATAEKWEPNADKTVWTFYIRGDAKWSNGDKVTAKDFEWTYKRLLTPKEGQSVGVTMGANSYQPTLDIVGALDYVSGKLKDWSQVGIKALDDTRLQIKVVKPNPDFLLLLTHPSMLALHPATVEKFPQDWEKPANVVTNGPFKMKDWVMNTSMTMVKNEKYWNVKNVALDTVEVNLTTINNPGVPYESGELEVVGLPGPDIVRFRADPKLSKELVALEANTVAYLAVLRSKNPVMEDLRVRKAFALALDMESLAKVDPGSRPGGQLVPPRVPKWSSNDSYKYNLAEAKKLLADAGYPDGKGFPEVKILSGLATNTHAQAIADLWSKALNIKVSLDVVEAGVYVQRRWQVQEANYVGFYWGTFSTQSTWASWVGLLWPPAFTQEFSMKAGDWAQYQAIQNDKNIAAAEKPKRLEDFRRAHASKEALAFEDAFNKAMAELDENKQIELFREAARIRQEQYLFLPVLYLDRIYAVKPTVKGLQLHAGGRPFYVHTLSNEK